MKMNCLSCGHVVDLRDSYDDYEGQIKCFVCGALLSIRTENGQVKSVQFVSGRAQISNSVSRQMQQATADAEANPEVKVAY